MNLVTPREAFDTPSTHPATPSGMAAVRAGCLGADGGQPAGRGGVGAPGQRLAAG